MNLENNQKSGLVSFFHVVCNLKKVRRSGWIHKANIPSPESVADHSYSMCMMSMVLSEILNLDTEHIMKMANLHDLAESIVGDSMPDVISHDEKIIKEDTAMRKIISKLPENLCKKYMDIWNEYVENKTLSSKFVHNIDKFEMAMQAKAYELDGYSKQSLQLFLRSAANYISDDNFNLVSELLQTMNSNSDKI
ncbi:MAG TPA: HD domain-containing protein [Nitrososphaeraceae archaeon]|nr:HD domain-containing protein [Nitrososphaeraceae archaeon]